MDGIGNRRAEEAAPEERPAPRAVLLRRPRFQCGGMQGEDLRTWGGADFWVVLAHVQSVEFGVHQGGPLCQDNGRACVTICLVGSEQGDGRVVGLLTQSAHQLLHDWLEGRA